MATAADVPQILGIYGSLPFERAACQWCAEASIYLRKNAHRKGIGRQLYAAREYGLEGNYVAGANIAGFLKVADAMMCQGAV